MRLGAIATIIGGYAFPSESIKSEKGYRVIRISDFNDSKIVYNKVVRYNGDADLAQYEICERDILMAMTGGTVGKSVFLTELPEKHMLLNQRVAIIRNKYIFDEYLNLVITSPITIDVVNSRKNSTNDNISMVDIYNFLVPVPPTNEQKRIVQKIQEALPIVRIYGKSQEALDKLNADIFDKLKKSVLQEAIQGRLVPQDPNDESASVLLERIKAEKAKLFAEGKLKKKDLVDSVIFKGDDNKYYEKISSEVTCIDDEIPFEIPDSWVWIRLGNIFQHNTGKALNGSNQKGVFYDYITTSNLYWNSFVLGKLRSMPFTDDELDKCTVKKGDLLVCEGGDIGRSAIWNYDYDIRIQNHIHRLRAYTPICTMFVYYTLYLYKHTGLIGGKGIGIQGLSSNALHKLLLPLPSIAEQKRIVDKVEFVIASITRR